MPQNDETAAGGQESREERFHRLVKEAMLDYLGPIGITEREAMAMLASFADHAGFLLYAGSNEHLSTFLKEIVSRRHFYRTIGNKPVKLPRDWRARRAAVFKRDKYTCVYCGATGTADTLHCDHFEPRSNAGSDDESNLVTACATCNTRKGARSAEDWLQ